MTLIVKARLFENRYPKISVKNSKKTSAMKCNFKTAVNLQARKSYFTDVSMDVLWNFNDKWIEARLGVLQSSSF